jgi:hypothetical protein
MAVSLLTNTFRIPLLDRLTVPYSWVRFDGLQLADVEYEANISLLATILSRKLHAPVAPVWRDEQHMLAVAGTGAPLTLHKAGFRYRFHDRRLPGSPDLVLPRSRAAIFVHGCYWHSHGSYKSTVPKSQAGGKATVHDARSLGAKLEGGAKWTADEVGKCVSDLGSEIERLGSNI